MNTWKQARREFLPRGMQHAGPTPSPVSEFAWSIGWWQSVKVRPLQRTFFWSQHYDVAINYVGHAESWDAIKVDGDIENRDCSVRYERDGRTLAMVTISRDLESLLAESEMEKLMKG